MLLHLTALLLTTTLVKASQPIVIAHRGASGYLPEHTLPGKALAHAMRADFLEQDLVLSKDDVPIVMHDITLDTSTDVARRFPDRKREDGRYYALDFTVAELKQLEACERFNPKTGKAVYPNRFPLGQSAGTFRLSTLEEELQFIQGLNHSNGRVAGIYPEIKQPAWHRKQGHDISRIVLPILEKYGYRTTEDLCWIQCFELEETKRIRTELGWKGHLVLLMGGKAPTSPADLAEIAKVADGIGPAIGMVVTGKSPADRHITSLVKDAHAAKLAVHPYTLRIDELPKCAATPEELLHALFDEAGVDGLFSDFPDVVVKWLHRAR